MTSTLRAEPPSLSSIQQEIERIELVLRRRNVLEDIERSLAAKVRPMLHPSRYKGLYGGRGGMKSQTFARLLIHRCKQHPGTRWLCGREIQLSLTHSVKKLLEDTIALFGLDDEFEIRSNEIRTPGGGVIIFQGLQAHSAESIKSLEGFDGAWIEEAQTISARSLELLRPTIRKDGSEMWFSWNPEQATDPVEMLRSTPPEDTLVIEVNWQDNPFFPAVLRKEMEGDYGRDAESAAHVWGGKYRTRSKASVFKNFRKYDFETPNDAAFLLGGDWGFSVDPTVLVRGFVATGTLRSHLIEKLGLTGSNEILCLDAESWQVGCEIDDTAALFDALDPLKPAMAREWEIIADSARPETISFLQNHGYPRIIGARKGAGSVEEGLKFLQRFDIVVHSRCEHCFEELEGYRYKTHPLTGAVMPQLEDKKNHTIDSIRYMVEKMHLTSWVTW